MGKFSNQGHKRSTGNNKKPHNYIEFSCTNCLNFFNFVFNDIYLKTSGDLEFVPEPTCPRCGSRDDLVFSDYSQEKIEDMIFKGQIRRAK